MGNPKRRKRVAGILAAEKIRLEEEAKKAAMSTRPGPLKLRKKAAAEKALLKEATKAFKKKVTTEMALKDFQADLMADAVAETNNDDDMARRLYFEFRMNQLLEAGDFSHASRAQLIEKVKALPKPKPKKTKRKRTKRNLWRKD